MDVKILYQEAEELGLDERGEEALGNRPLPLLHSPGPEPSERKGKQECQGGMNGQC